MMKKFLVALLLAGCSHGALAAPQTFDEAFSSLSEKVKMRDSSALEDADQVLELAQTSEQKAKVRLRIGDANFSYDKPATARQQYEQVLKLPDLNSALKNTALVMIATTYQFQYPPDYPKARATFQRIVDGKEFSDLDKIAARLKIVSIYQQLGDNVTAHAQLQNIAQDTNSGLWAQASAFQLLAEMDRMEKKYSAARANYERFAALIPNDVTSKMFALDGIGQSYLEEKKFLQSRQKFAEILKFDVKIAPEPNRPALEMLQAQAQINIAKTYASEGDKTRARAEYAKVSLMPASEYYADQVKDELEKLDVKPAFAP